jgi:hypothetical protein
VKEGDYEVKCPRNEREIWRNLTSEEEQKQWKQKVLKEKLWKNWPKAYLRIKDRLKQRNIKQRRKGSES